MKKITVNENEEFRVKVITDFNENEFFYDAFVKAKVETELIVKDTVTYHKTKNDTMLDFSNNIIAFSGDRGQGKSSAMLSFSNLLKNCKLSSNRDFLGNTLSENNYVVLDRIDPTKFEDNDNILLIIIGKIFKIFCNLWNNSDKNNMVQYSNLLDQFQLCYDEIMTIKKAKESEHIFVNALETLGKIGDSTNLKNDLWKLLELFFDFENKCTNKSNAKEKNYLVIQLDDTDLNTQNAYKIVEDIRKYFMIPNVIVLMAIDISQLTKAIEQYFIEKYLVFNEYYENQHLIEHRKVAVKYIDKLIPGDRKIYLPKLTLITGENAEKVSLEYLDSNKKNILCFKDRNDNDINDIQELIIRLIYEKTGIVFVKPKTYVHDIIPNTMRELVNFLSILNKMPETQNSYTDLDDLNTRMDNIKKFETYIVEVWIPNYVHFRYHENVTNFIVASMATKNKQFIKDIKAKLQPIFMDDYSSKENSALNSNDSIIDLIKNIEAREVYSLADIRSVLNAFENEYPQEDTYKFVFAIKTLYTIYLSKIICSQLIHEKNHEFADVDLLLDFIGGKIFSDDEINKFIRKENGKINRGAYEIVAAYNEDAQNSINKLICEKSYLISFFLNFKFKSPQGNLPEYKTPYQVGNGVKSKFFKYEAFSPIIKFLDPISSIKRLGPKFNLPFKVFEDFYKIRNNCMRLVSNVELINYIGKKLKNYSSMRSEKGSYHEYIVNLYVRLDNCISEINYLNLDISFKDLTEKIVNVGNEIDVLYYVYKDIDADFDAQKLEKREALSEYLTKLNSLRNTRTFEKISNKVSDLLKNLTSYDTVLNDSILGDYIIKLKNLQDETGKRSGDMNSENRSEYQGAYNRILRELKSKFKIDMEA